MMLSAMVVVYNGMIWFLVGILLVAANDTFAYIVGKLFGKTPLFALSPKKTVEGFLGGCLFSILFGILLGYLSTFEFMNPLLCP